MPKITIYSTHTCIYCSMLKKYLEQKNIVFNEIYLDDQPESIQASFDTCGSMGVPCTHILLDDGKEEKILGFNKAKFNQILGIN